MKKLAALIFVSVLALGLTIKRGPHPTVVSTGTNNQAAAGDPTDGATTCAAVGDQYTNTTDLSRWYCNSVAADTWLPWTELPDLIPGGITPTQKKSAWFSVTGAGMHTEGATLKQGCAASIPNFTNNGFCNTDSGASSMLTCGDDSDCTGGTCDLHPDLTCTTAANYNESATIDSEHSFNEKVEYSFLASGEQTPGAVNIQMEHNRNVTHPMYEVALSGITGNFTAGEQVLYDAGGGVSTGRGRIVAVRVVANIQEDGGTALGTHSTTTLEDTTKSGTWTTNLHAGHVVNNVTKDEARTIISNTTTVLTVASWTAPDDTDVYTIASAGGLNDWVDYSDGGNDPPVDTSTLSNLIGFYTTAGTEVGQGRVVSCTPDNCVAATELVVDLVSGDDDLASAATVVDLQGTTAGTAYANFTSVAADPTRAWIVHFAGTVPTAADTITGETSLAVATVGTVTAAPMVHRVFQWSNDVDEMSESGSFFWELGQGESVFKASRLGMTAGFNDGAQEGGLKGIGSTGIVSSGVHGKVYLRAPTTGTIAANGGQIEHHTADDMDHATISSFAGTMNITGDGENVDVSRYVPLSLAIDFDNTGSLIGKPTVEMISIAQDYSSIDGADELGSVFAIDINSPVVPSSGAVDANYAINIDDQKMIGNSSNAQVIRIRSQTDDLAQHSKDGDHGNVAFEGGNFNNGHLQFGDDAGSAADHLWRDSAGEGWYSSTDGGPANATDGDMFVLSPNGKATVGTMMWSDGVAAAEDTGTEVCALVGMTCIDTRLLSAMGSTVSCATDHASAYFTALCAVP